MHSVQRCPTIIDAVEGMIIAMIHGVFGIGGWLFSWTYYSGVFGRDDCAMQVGLASECLMTFLLTEVIIGSQSSKQYV